SSTTPMAMARGRQHPTPTTIQVPSPLVMVVYQRLWHHALWRGAKSPRPVAWGRAPIDWLPRRLACLQPLSTALGSPTTPQVCRMAGASTRMLLRYATLTRLRSPSAPRAAATAKEEEQPPHR